MKIPIRPKDYDKVAIGKNDADCLTYYVLMGGSGENAFRLFHPEYLGADGKLTIKGKEASKQFFMYAKNREYIDAYKAELTDFLARGDDDDATEIDDSRKDRALKALLHQAMSLIEGNPNLDPETLKIVTEIFKKIGLLKDEETEAEAPRRYLPLKCSECQYRQFVESHIKSGEIVNECDCCKTRKYAEDRGWRYDPTHNLELPTENN